MFFLLFKSSRRGAYAFWALANQRFLRLPVPDLREKKEDSHAAAGRVKLWWSIFSGLHSGADGGAAIRNVRAHHRYCGPMTRCVPCAGPFIRYATLRAITAGTDSAVVQVLCCGIANESALSLPHSSGQAVLMSVVQPSIPTQVPPWLLQHQSLRLLFGLVGF